MSKASKQRFTDKYLDIQTSYKEINAIFMKFENNEIPKDQEERIIDDVISEIKSTSSSLRRLNIKDIRGEYEDSFIQEVKNNMAFMEDALTHFYDTLMAARLYDEIIDPLRAYVRNMHTVPSEYKKWANDEQHLTIKFADVLVRHYELFKNQIKRLALGTMSQKEFNKIYHANKHKMIPIYTFESFLNYKDH